MDSSLAKDANFQLGFLYFARKDFPDAVPYFEAALRIDPNFLSALMNIGLAEYALKQPTVGNDYLRRALVVNPKENRPRIWIAQTLTALDSLPEAQEMYQAAIVADSTNAEAYRGSGVVLLLQKNWPDAITPLELAVKIEPENLQGHIWLAQAYSNSGQIDKAKAEFNKAIDIDPNNAEAARGLGFIRKYEEQKAAKAAAAASKAAGGATGTTTKAGAKTADPPASGTATKGGAGTK